jgi:streptogramin lyase
MDNDGQFWMGASSQTNDKELLFRIDPKTQTVTEKASIPSSYRDTWFGHPTFMTADGSVWFSEKVDEGNTGLYHYTIPTGKLSPLRFSMPHPKISVPFCVRLV